MCHADFGQRTGLVLFAVSSFSDVRRSGHLLKALSCNNIVGSEIDALGESGMYRKVLIATDGSELGSLAVDHGVALAKTVGASVIFVTVTERWTPINVVEFAERGDPDPVGRYMELSTQSARRILAAASDIAQAAGVECETLHVHDNVPAQGIIAAANDCDLIVMASHGRRGISRLVLGSQASEVLAYSKIPVLVLR